MIDPNSKLTVLHDDNSTFVDLSNDASDFTRDNFNLELISAEDYLYIGFYKPFGTVFAALVTPNVNSNTLAAEYWNGTSWTALSIIDESRGLTRSGFISWDRDSMQSTTINGVAAYYVRLKPDVDHSVTLVRGINLVFADDAALKQEFFEIDNSNLLPKGESSHLVHHVAARNTILQRLRNLQYIKTNSNGQYANITQWDLFDMFEIKQAAVMLTLSKIFFLLSDSTEDQWWAKYREYQDKFEEAFSLARLSLDQDDDGLKDDSENLKVYKVNRWVR